MFPTPVFTNTEILTGYKKGIFNLLGGGNNIGYFNVGYDSEQVPVLFEFNNGEIVLQLDINSPVAITDFGKFKKALKATLFSLLNIGNISLLIPYDQNTYPDYVGTFTSMLPPPPAKPNKIVFQMNNSGNTDISVPVNVEITIDLLKKYTSDAFYMLVFKMII
jgi:hypothetical protein